MKIYRQTWVEREGNIKYTEIRVREVETLENTQRERGGRGTQDILAWCRAGGGRWVSLLISVGPRVQTDRRRKTGNRDQFCQNWVHTPGAKELGWPSERQREEVGALELFIALYSYMLHRKETHICSVLYSVNFAAFTISLHAHLRAVNNES